MKILVVEDDLDLNTVLTGVLRDAGFVVDTAFDGEQADFLGGTGEYDSIVLDLGLPKVDGLTVLRRWRESGQNAPVLVLTARGRWSEKLAGFNAGADDYVTKPFEMEEVVVRLHALIRRSAGHASPELRCGTLLCDTMRGQISENGVPLVLTALEYRILSYLLHHPDTVISGTELLEHVYGSDVDPDSNVVNVIIGRIRKKLRGDHIATVRGRGFKVNSAQ